MSSSSIDLQEELAQLQAKLDELHERICHLEASAEHGVALLLKSTERAARAEGEALALRDALTDLSHRLDVALNVGGHQCRSARFGYLTIAGDVFGYPKTLDCHKAEGIVPEQRLITGLGATSTFNRLAVALPSP